MSSGLCIFSAVFALSSVTVVVECRSATRGQLPENSDGVLIHGIS